MTPLNPALSMTVPLGVSAHQQAQAFSQDHRYRRKAYQVYLNTLSVCAVRFYLQCMGIETRSTASASWNPMMQALMDVADLEIPGCGIVECRPVLPEATCLTIPPDVWTDRISYVAVQLESALTVATLLGFVPVVETGEISLARLRSLDDWMRYLQQLRSKVTLNQWLKGIFTTGWRSLDELMGDRPRLALSLRSETAQAEQPVKRAKLLDFGLQLQQQPLTLLMALTPTSDALLSVSVQLHPGAGESYLPADVTLSLLTDTGEFLQQVRSRSQDNYIQLKRFSGTIGTNFDIQITLGEVKLTESFVL